MAQGAGKLHILLRTGFDHDESTARALGEAFHNATVTAWAPEEWPQPVLARIQEMTEEWLLFIDGAYPLFPAQTMHNALRRVANTKAMTLHTPALEGLLPLKRQQGFSLPQQRQAIAGLPPWWSLVQREAFLASAPEQWHSLEYALAAFAQDLTKQGNPPLALGREALAFEAIPWVERIFPRIAAGLAADWRQWQEAERGYIPPQYAVESYGIWHDPQSHDMDGRPPTFSLLCPAFKATYIDELLDSVCAQTYPHWELLLRIDGPPEPDCSILRERLENRSNEARIRWQLQDNCGTAATRQLLAEAATKDFIVFLDDDDRIAPDALAAFANALDCYPEAGAVRGGAQLFGLVDRYLPPRQRYTLHEISADLFEVNQPFAVRRSLLESLGGLEGDPAFGGVGEDTDLFLRLEASKTPVVLIDAPLYYRRISPLNQTLLFDGRQFTGHIRTLAARHLLPSWHVAQLQFGEEGEFVRHTIQYRQDGTDTVVYCPTRYFNFHTLGQDHAQYTVLQVLQQGEISRSVIEALLQSRAPSAPTPTFLLTGMPSPLHATHLEDLIRLLHCDGAKVELLLPADEASHARLDALCDLGVSAFHIVPIDAEPLDLGPLREQFPHATLLSVADECPPLPWYPHGGQWTAQAPIADAQTEEDDSQSAAWQAAGVCPVAVAWDVYTSDGAMVVCPREGAETLWSAPIQEVGQGEGRLLKLGRYRRGHFTEWCRDCPHCPGNAPKL